MAGKNSVFVNNSAPSVDDTWLNLQQSEGNNIILGSGQSLSDAINNQRVIGVSRFAANNFYIDSGSANAYVLTLAASMTNPVSSTVGYFIGMTIRFRAGNANTGASTVNVNSAGVKNLKKENGTTDLASGDILTNKDVEFRYDGTSFVLVQNVLDATTSTKGASYLPKQITIANNSTDSEHDIDFSAGNAQADDGSLVFSVIALTKRIDANWVAGTNQGGLFAGTVANNTWYHCFVIYNPTTSASDAGFDTSTIAANAPSGFTKYDYRCSVLTNGSGNIIAFRQDGKTITFSPVLVYTNTSVGTTFSTFTAIAPLGIRVKCLLSGVVDGGNGINGMIVKDKISGFQKQVIYADDNDSGSEFLQFCDLSSSIDIAKSTSATLDDFIVYSTGWEIPDNLY